MDVRWAPAVKAAGLPLEVGKRWIDRLWVAADDEPGLFDLAHEDRGLSLDDFFDGLTTLK
jgi:hypothetical protein